MYKATSEGLQRAARVGAQQPHRKAIDPEMLRESDELEGEYIALRDKKIQLEKSMIILNVKIEQYKTSAVRARYTVDNPHYRSLMQERKRISHAIADVTAEMMRVKAPLKLARRALDHQRSNLFAGLFRQAAKIILADELYQKVSELAQEMEKTALAQANQCTDA